MKAIKQLADAVGLQERYTNAWGKPTVMTDQIREALLTAMGYSIDSEKAIEETVHSMELSQWQSILAPVYIVGTEQKQAKLIFRIPVLLLKQSAILTITDEQDEKIYQEQLQWSALKEVDRIELDGDTYLALEYATRTLPMGYFTLSLQVDNQSQQTRLISAPRACYNPPALKDSRLWGFAAQLYSVKSDEQLGIGNFHDLKRIIEHSASADASVIGLNPLHPLFPNNPAHCSPYSPTSRRYLNTSYISVHEAARQQDCTAVLEQLNSTELQDKISQVNDSELIDYVGASGLREPLLEALFAHFETEHRAKQTSLAKEFDSYCSSEGKDLDELATYDALYEHFRAKDSMAFGWPSWPEAYQRPDSKEVAEFKSSHKSRIDFYKYCQWLANEQLGAAADAAKTSGMDIGLYLDLAVGCDGSGAEVWADPEVFLKGVSIGAPPDVMNAFGQDWGLTPMNPVALKQAGYEPFIRALRNNMQHAGALRIDHVFGLMRQYWVAPGFKAHEGGFITFPLDDLLRILALESHRAECLVIGEDLGTTPEGFNERVAEAGMLSYKVLFFERWETGLFQRPVEYPEQAMVTVSTHDLPTLPGWWTGRDIEWRKKLELYTDEAMKKNEIEGRVADREVLIDALKDAEVLVESHTNIDNIDSTCPNLIAATQRFLAKTPGQLLMIPLEDALGIHEQVNIPGTIDEHPNWRQKLPLTLDEMMDNEVMKRVIGVMNEERPTQRKKAS